MKQIYFLIMICSASFIFTLLGCEGRGDWLVMESYPDGKPKHLYQELSGGQKRIHKIDESGNIMIDYYLNARGELTGWSIWYNENGSISAKCQYTDGVKEGVGFIYNEDGDLTEYNYYSQGRCVYALTYKNDSLNSQGEEIIAPILTTELSSDMDDKLVVHVNLPLPDSLWKNRTLDFVIDLKLDKPQKWNFEMGGMKSLQLTAQSPQYSDTIILHSNQKVQYLSYYLLDEVNKHIHLGNEIYKISCSEEMVCKIERDSLE